MWFLVTTDVSTFCITDSIQDGKASKVSRTWVFHVLDPPPPGCRFGILWGFVGDSLRKCNKSYSIIGDCYWVGCLSTRSTFVGWFPFVFRICWKTVSENEFMKVHGCTYSVDSVLNTTSPLCVVCLLPSLCGFFQLDAFFGRFTGVECISFWVGIPFEPGNC